jgi:hypothetical protein
MSNWQIVSAVKHGIHVQASARCAITCCDIRNFNNASLGNHGILLQDSLVISVTGNQIYSTTPATGKALVESGSSNYNLLVGNAFGVAPTIIGANTVNANNLVV